MVLRAKKPRLKKCLDFATRILSEKQMKSILISSHIERQSLIWQRTAPSAHLYAKTVLNVVFLRSLLKRLIQLKSVCVPLSKLSKRTLRLEKTCKMPLEIRATLGAISTMLAIWSKNKPSKISLKWIGTKFKLWMPKSKSKEISMILKWYKSENLKKVKKCLAKLQYQKLPQIM